MRRNGEVVRSEMWHKPPSVVLMTYIHDAFLNRIFISMWQFTFQLLMWQIDYFCNRPKYKVHRTRKCSFSKTKTCFVLTILLTILYEQYLNNNGLWRPILVSIFLWKTKQRYISANSIFSKHKHITNNNNLDTGPLHLFSFFNCDQDTYGEKPFYSFLVTC